MGNNFEGYSSDAIVEQLNSKDENKRLEAARFLNKLNNPIFIPILTSTIKDEFWAVRMYSVSTLGNLQVQDALPLIIEALKDNHELVREHAARALVKLSNLAALEPLLAALKDEKSDVRYNVALALGQLGDKRALPALKQLQKDKNLTSYRVEVREAAIEAIRNIQEQNR